MRILLNIGLCCSVAATFASGVVNSDGPHSESTIRRLPPDFQNYIEKLTQEFHLAIVTARLRDALQAHNAIRQAQERRTPLARLWHFRDLRASGEKVQRYLGCLNQLHERLGYPQMSLVLVAYRPEQ